MNNIIYVITNVELGFNCVVDVCEDFNYAKQTYSEEQYYIKQVKINTNKISASKLVLNLYDKNKHLMLIDGCMKNKNDIEPFLIFVKKFNETSKYKIDFINDNNCFYFVVLKEDIFNLSDNDFWEEYVKKNIIFNKYEELSDLVVDNLIKSNIYFQ